MGLIIFMQVIDGNLAPSGGDKPVYLKTVILGRVFLLFIDRMLTISAFNDNCHQYFATFRYH